MENSRRENITKLFYALFEKEYENSSFLKKYTNHYLLADNEEHDFGAGAFCARKDGPLGAVYASQSAYHPIQIGLTFSFSDLELFEQKGPPTNCFLPKIKDFINRENKLFIDFLGAIPSNPIGPVELSENLSVLNNKKNNYLILNHKNNLEEYELETLFVGPFKNYNIIVETKNFIGDKWIMINNVPIESFNSKPSLNWECPFTIFSYDQNVFYFYKKIEIAAFLDNGKVFRYSPSYVKSKPVIFEEAIFNATEKEKIYYLDF